MILRYRKIKPLFSELSFKTHEYNFRYHIMQGIFDSVRAGKEKKKKKIMMSFHSDRISFFSVDYFSFVRFVWQSSACR